MQIAARTGAWSGNTLPYLRRVAYLESHGTEWVSVPFISTGLTGLKFSVVVSVESSFSSMTDRVIIRFSNPSFSVNMTGLGIGWSGSYFWTILKNNYNRISTSHYRVGEKLNVEVDYDRNLFLINGRTVESTKSGEGGLRNVTEVWLLHASTGNFIAKLFAVKFQQGEQSFDLIPVLDLSGRPAMYDEVSGQLFYNQGTGEFTWGELDVASNAPSQLGGGITENA